MISGTNDFRWPFPETPTHSTHITVLALSDSERLPPPPDNHPGRLIDPRECPDTVEVKFIATNPKRPGTACNLRYEAYKSATTVPEFLEKGGTPADLTHDVGKGFVWYLDADDGRRPRGNQLLPVRFKKLARASMWKLRADGPQTRLFM